MNVQRYCNVEETVIDEIRKDMQVRLDEMADEAERLRKALDILGGPTRRTARAVRSGRTGRAQSAASRSKASSPAAKPTNATNGQRKRASGTKSSVLEALAAGKAMTASEVAGATGLGRASVSTTLSKLAKSGEVRKADRGYELAR